MSVSVPSPTAEHALSIFKAHGGVLKTKSAMELGIHPRTLYALRDADRLERLDRGLYRIADGKPLENPDLLRWPSRFQRELYASSRHSRFIA